MLSRTASDLFWMSRHVERAENAARMLDITYRMSLLPYQVLEPGQEWAEPWSLPLITSGLATAYYERYDELSADNVINFMALDAGNPSSIYSCLHSARESARAQRGAITSEMWESINATWIEMRSMDFPALKAIGIGEYFELVKMRSHLFRGITFGTMLRDEGYSFIRMGTLLERADNTARILDVKYHTLLPSVFDVGGAVDYYQWGALLRSVSAFEAYRRIYRDIIVPRRVAELLILRADLPRSLHACMNEIYDTLQQLSDSRSIEPERLAGEMHAQLHYGRVEEIFAVGLHEYLMAFVQKIGKLGGEISNHFLAPT
ncbi:MAG: alpha-E domain-containing protein [Burkholderiales bacterium]|nr:alpha-E domain-containing protein [Burkholderiales bacterium]